MDKIYENKNKRADMLYGDQNKYIYFIITLSSAGIGFGIQNTSSAQIDTWFLVLWLLAEFSWAASILYGFDYLERKMNFFYADITRYDVLKEQQIPITSKTTEFVDTIFTESAKKANNRIAQSMGRQKILFLVGCTAYILWHISRMYVATSSNLLPYLLPNPK
jgi:hypothetical protein